MKHPTAMSESRPSSEATPRDDAAPCSGIRERILLGLVLFTLVRTSEALAGDQASMPNAALEPDLGNSRQVSPAAMATLGSFSAPAAGIPVFSPTEFRPRKHTVFDSDAGMSAFGDAPLLRSTTVWQRLSDYKSQNRVRLLTLWQSSSNSLSLQSGTRGNPSLQWSSRRMNRDGATRGLFDRLVSAALRETGNSPRPSPSRSVAAPAAIKPSNLSAAAGAQ